MSDATVSPGTPGAHRGRGGCRRAAGRGSRAVCRVGGHHLPLPGASSATGASRADPEARSAPLDPRDGGRGVARSGRGRSGRDPGGTLHDVGSGGWEPGACVDYVARLGAVAGDLNIKTLYASEQEAVARAQWRAEVQSLSTETFVFVDESSTGLNMTRRYARTPRGERAYGYVPRNYGTRTTLIAALSPAGMGAAMTLAGAVDTAVFEAYVEQCLVPELRPGQMVIMDNLSSHKSPAIEAAIEG